MKIERIRIYQPKNLNPHFHQSDMVVTIETDEGLTGIGEGGSRDTLTQCAGMLIGEDPTRIQHLWQMMYRGFFYPAGREKLHAIGALDLALWDLKGKMLGTPVYELLGGKSRDYIECYSTSYPWQGSLGETAQACIGAGFRAFRMGAGDIQGNTFDTHRQVDRTAAGCREVREALGPDSDWSIDFHTRFDLADAVRLCTLIEPYNPFLVEDPLRSENPGMLAALRPQVKVPLAVGEQFGDRWDINELVERHLIDYSRVTLPNTGGITEMMKIAALCETHYIGLVPHFTGPFSLAALVHVMGSLPVPVLMEIVGTKPAQPAHVAQGATFRDGKLWPEARPGLGIEFDPAGTTLIAEVSERFAPIPMYHRPDGSFTNW
ncbi:MAG: mandelate racemase/muconate lactonizing enzyme family protein [Anaerolineaceae bacterium]|nr:mandelate racemase/muconate lactonizing enzyme family protein [Anaerolineaceae bacterium]